MQKTKLTDEEMKQIKNFREKVSQLTVDVGDLQLNRVLLENALEEVNLQYDKLIKEFKQSKQNEKEFVTSLKSKYGDGQILIDSGEFIKSN